MTFYKYSIISVVNVNNSLMGQSNHSIYKECTALLYQLHQNNETPQSQDSHIIMTPDYD